MATKIPPHNLTEVVNAVLLMIGNYIEHGTETDIADIIQIIKGPDFPTGATILGTNGIKQAYLTGRGNVVIRSDVEVEPMDGGREMIIVKELPYQVNKLNLIKKIADLVKDKKVDGITDIRDESEKEIIRVVIELRRDANAAVILNNLYKYSQLQESFGIIMLVLVNGEPKVLNIKEVLEEYLKHQKVVVTRRTQFDLNKALKRAHLVEGFLKALDYIDEIIKIIRANREISKSKEIITERFGFSVEQADAIVEMRLRSLSGLEREKLEAEYAELMKIIEEFRKILGDEKRLLEVIRDEITVIRDKFGDGRRTKIVPFEGEIEIADLINEEMNVITLTQMNYIKRLTLDTYTTQNRGGRGVMGMTTRDEDLVKAIFVASTHDDILFLTTHGKVFRKKAYEIPEAGRTAKGMAIVNLLNLSGGEKIASVIPVRDYTDGYLVMVTKLGIIKKTEMQLFKNISKSGLIALKIREDDELITVLRTTEDDEIFIATNSGMGIKFNEGNVRQMGRNATGVRAVRLTGSDNVIGAVMLEQGKKVLLASENGYGKCTEADEFRLQSRGGKGLRAYRVTEKTGKLIGIETVCDKDELMLINSEGVIIRIRVGDISTSGRVTMGVKLINLSDGVTVVNLAKVAEEEITSDDVSDDVINEEVISNEAEAE
jgi:DNA gyrase subunit A